MIYLPASEMTMVVSDQDKNMVRYDCYTYLTLTGQVF